MSLTIKRGYLISQQDYDLFDAILIFLVGPNERWKVFAPGVRKITSKNSRNLFFGNYLEFEFFQARDTNKFSKLKKVTTLSNIGFELNNHQSLLLISNILSHVNHLYHYDFDFYQKTLNNIILGYSIDLIDTFIYLYFLKTRKILANTNIKCCYRPKTEIIGYDWKRCLFVCQKCLSMETVLLEPATIINFQNLLFNQINLDNCLLIPDLKIIKKICEQIFNHNRKLIYEK